MQPLAILFGAAFTAAVSMAFGNLLFRKSLPDPALRFVTGSALLSLLVFLLCTLHQATPLVFVFCGAGILACGRLLGGASPNKIHYPQFFPLFVLFFLLYFFNSLAPEISYDGSRYHLSLVGRYFRDHGFHAYAGTMYAALTQGAEMLYLFAYAFGRHSAAAMVHFTFLCALAWMIAAYGRRAGFPLAGICAAFLVFAAPVIGADAASAYNDVALAAAAFALFFALRLHESDPHPRLPAAIGLLAGFCFAVKYTGWLAIPYAIGSVAWSTRKWRDTLMVTASSALVVLPWAIKNWIMYQNPLAPFFNRYFPNQLVSNAFEMEYRKNMATQGVLQRWEIPLQVTTYGSLGGILGPVLLLSPLALLALRRREGRQLLFAAFIFSANYFSNIGVRFLIPAVPFVALALCLVLATVPRLALGVVALHAVLSWPWMLRRYVHPDDWHLAKIPYREALRIKPEDGFLESNLPLYGAARLVERLTPPGSTVFTTVPIPDAYTTRTVLVAHETAANIVSKRILWSAFVPEHQPTRQLRITFQPQSVAGLRMIQTAEGGEPWAIHEVHFLDAGREIQRSPEWALTASSAPWAIESAFDRNLATLWISGDTLAPGQIVQTEFHRTTQIDAVFLDLAPDQAAILLKLEGNVSGRWTPIQATQAFAVTPDPADMRRQAALELKRRGIDYLLVMDDEFGAADFHTRAAEWGIRPVGGYKGARLYQLP